MVQKLKKIMEEQGRKLQLNQSTHRKPHNDMGRTYELHTCGAMVMGGNGANCCTNMLSYYFFTTFFYYLTTNLTLTIKVKFNSQFNNKPQRMTTFVSVKFKVLQTEEILHPSLFHSHLSWTLRVPGEE